MIVYLICYDVVNNRRRNQIAKFLEGYGLRVQKSVFECMLSDAQYEFMKQHLQKLLNRKEDQLRFYPLSAHCRQKVEILGIKPEFAVDANAFIV